MRASKESQLELKSHLIVTSLDGEGMILDLDTRKTFWINETAVSLLKLFDEKVPLSYAKSFLQEQYLINDRGKMTRDLTFFINYLKWYGLLFPRLAASGTNFKNPKSRPKKPKPYLKPMIEEETDILSIGGNVVRAARSRAARSQAVRSATQAGFKGFR